MKCIGKLAAAAIVAIGMRYVIVNGKLAVDDGRYTGILAGQSLRKDST